MKRNPIGVFDSGLGGLSTVKAIKDIMPNEDIIYFGDTGRVPYGGRSEETIIKYSLQDINFLKSMDVKIIIVACGTVSSQIEKIKTNENIIGVIAPTCRAAVKSTKNSKIGVIATTATINSKSYEKQIKKLKPDAIISSTACPLLVPLIENGFINENDEVLEKILKIYLNPLKKEGVDTLILGCTHYPLIEKAIEKTFENKIKLINSGLETAKHLKKYLVQNNLNCEDEKTGAHKFFVSDGIENFLFSAKNFLGYDIKDKIKQIDITTY